MSGNVDTRGGGVRHEVVEEGPEYFDDLPEDLRRFLSGLPVPHAARPIREALDGGLTSAQVRSLIARAMAAHVNSQRLTVWGDADRHLIDVDRVTGEARMRR